jgi:hypothetical protein
MSSNSVWAHAVQSRLWLITEWVCSLCDSPFLRSYCLDLASPPSLGRNLPSVPEPSSSCTVAEYTYVCTRPQTFQRRGLTSSAPLSNTCCCKFISSTDVDIYPSITPHRCHVLNSRRGSNTFLSCLKQYCINSLQTCNDITSSLRHLSKYGLGFPGPQLPDVVMPAIHMEARGCQRPIAYRGISPTHCSARV